MPVLVFVEAFRDIGCHSWVFGCRNGFAILVFNFVAFDVQREIIRFERLGVSGYARLHGSFMLNV